MLPTPILAALLTTLAIPPAARDSLPDTVRVVRRFPPVEVRAPVHDLRSSETVHAIGMAALGSLAVDDLAQVLALQAGVVAQGEELHVRGGRVGEAAMVLDGVTLVEPFRQRPLEVPILALRGADLVSGAPEARYASGLAGVLDLHTLDPGPRPAVEWRWQGDGGTDTRFDRVSGRVSGPLHVLGLGAVIAGDGTFDDTYLPALRTRSRHDLAGLQVGWRAENRMLGSLKLAPVAHPERFSAQLLVGRQVHEPYDAAWTLDGWTLLPASPKSSPTFSPVYVPGAQRYRAADHLAMTDDRQLAALISLASLSPTRRGALSVGWVRTRTVTSVGGRAGATETVPPAFGANADSDRFHVLWGDYPYYRQSGGDVFTLRGDGELRRPGGGGIGAGLGLTYDEVTAYELDRMVPVEPIDWNVTSVPLDSVRAYQAFAPGGFAYVQGRWPSGGMVLNAGLRADVFDPGPQAGAQTVPGRARAIVALSPRLGIAYPISVRDAFSLSYVRLDQAPGRDYLYDHRQAIGARQPLGNPALEPSTVISYEASVKHVFDATLALQASVFFRDVFGQVGARNYSVPGGPLDLRYENADEGHAVGFEWSLLRVRGERDRLELHYTWMQAWGSESQPEGDPYGPILAGRIEPSGDTPLSWDRRHSLVASGAWRWRERWTAAWSTGVGSPLPWTPKARRQSVTDLSVVNSARFQWTENTNLDLAWSPPFARGLVLGLEARNLFDSRGERLATVDGYPNPIINTRYDDYGAYRTETGLGGGAYWSDPHGDGTGQWVPVHDPRLDNPPRSLRLSVGGRW